MASSIADLYYRGDGVEKKLDEAAEWFRKAADGHYPPAMFHLGYLYGQGQGVKRDLVQAYRWMKLAANFGDERAEKGIELLEKNMSPEQLAPARQAIEDAGIANPELIHGEQPEYPQLARVALIEGAVILQAVIYENGTVGDVEVLRSSRPNLGFEDAAINAVCRWRYEPVRMNGTPVTVYFTIFVQFKIQ